MTFEASRQRIHNYIHTSTDYFSPVANAAFEALGLDADAYDQVDHVPGEVWELVAQTIEKVAKAEQTTGTEYPDDMIPGAVIRAIEAIKEVKVSEEIHSWAGAGRG